MEQTTICPIQLETIVSPWPIASTLSSHLTAGDLISLARTSTGLRAVLHGFQKPLLLETAEDLELGTVRVSKHTVRHSLNIGFHDTLYWQRLKEEAQFVCSSPTHTRGDKCRACRFCSMPICEACIVRSSFQRGKENTFNNRVRYYCVECWDHGNRITKSRRYPLSSIRRHSEWYTSSGLSEDHCTCTLKDDGWLCLECKDRQNYQATTKDVKICHGEGCENPVGVHHERRRTCLWCHKTLPSPFGGASRHVWTQQMITAKQRSIQALSADIEEYNRTRLATMRMTRRQLRGECAVEDDPDADKPQYVRHLDTINYEHYMGHEAAPTGQEVYDSKRGFWRYNRRFLLQIRRHCRNVRPTADLLYVQDAVSGHARINVQKLEESGVYNSLIDIQKRVDEDFSDKQKQNFGITDTILKSRGLPAMFARNIWRTGTAENDQRVEEWHSLKAHILDAFFTQKLDLLQARVYLWHNYSFWAEKEEFEFVLTVWGQDFDVVEQPILPPTMSERDVIKTSAQELERSAVDESQDQEEEYDAAELYREWEQADERMCDLSKKLKPQLLHGKKGQEEEDEDTDDDNDTDDEDEIDQQTMFDLVRSENAAGRRRDISTSAERSNQGSNTTPDPSEDQQGPSSSLKRRVLHTESGRVPTYLEDMNTQLLGGLARRSTRDVPRERDEDVEMTFEAVQAPARESQTGAEGSS